MEKFKTNVVEDKPTKKVFTVEMPAEEVEKELKNTFDKLQTVASLPGFRPGKVPKEMVVTHFKETARQEMLDKVIPEICGEALEKLKYTPIVVPSIADLKYEEGKSLFFTVTVYVLSEFKIKKYKEINIDMPKAEIDSKEIDNVLKYLQQQGAEFVPVEDRELKLNDCVVIDFTGYIDGKQLKDLQAKDYFLETGTGKFMPDFEEGLIGAKINEEREVSTKFPEDFANKELAGKQCTFKVKIKSIREKKLPNLDDEFAKDLGDYKSIEELTKKIEKDILGEKETKFKQEAKNKILDVLIDENVFEIPEPFVLQELENMISNLKERMEREKFTFETLKTTEEELKEKWKVMAEKRVRGSFILFEIAKIENITVAEDEINKEIENILTHFSRNKERLDNASGYLHSSRGRETVKEDLLIEKVRELLFSSVKINTISELQKELASK
ncbi:MAG: trigger factor [Candidatus Firestonebacteria bacterium]